MKIVSINTFCNTGGASIAAVRILDALLLAGHDARLLTYYKDGEHDAVIPFTTSFVGEKMRWLRFVYERLSFLPYEVSKEIRFHFSLANAGVDLSKHDLVRQADIIHLHWFNKSYLSLEGLGKLLELGKPIVWTLHDMWAFTGGCHYNYNGCESYKSKCMACPMIKNSKKEDLSTTIWNLKKSTYKKGNLNFVTCSQWLGRELKSSALLKDEPVHAIPNPIDSDIFKPIDKEKVKTSLGLDIRKKQILFVAMNTSDKRKGFRYLVEALDGLPKDNFELLVIGKAAESFLEELPLKANYMGFVKSKSKMVEIYNAADVYVSPTLQDNLPNTIMESLACGTPVVAFKTGGVPEMITDELEGKLVEQEDSKGLGNAILWVLEDDVRYSVLSKNARSKILREYSYPTISKRYADLFQSLLDEK